MKVNKIYIISALFVSSLFMPVELIAQKKDKKEKKILSEKVEIVKSYTPNVKKASKLDIRPTVEVEEKIVDSKMNYKITYKPERFPFAVKKLEAPNMPLIAKDEAYNSYANLMLGAPFSSRANIYYTTTEQRNTIFGVGVNHNGFYGKIKNNNGDKISGLTNENKLNLNFKYQSQGYDIGISGQQSFDVYNRYGFSGEMRNEDTQQFYLKSNVNAYVSTNNNSPTAFNFGFRASYNYVVDKYNFQEHIYGADISFSKKFKNYGEFSFNTQYRSVAPYKRFQIESTGIVEDIETKVSTVGDGIFGEDRSFKSYSTLFIDPKYSYKVGKLDIEVSPKVVFDFGNGVNNDQSETQFIPELYLGYSMVGGGFKPYVKIDGRYRINSYYTLTALNPYVIEGITSPNTMEREFLVGVEGLMFGVINYNIYGGLSQMRNLIMFRNINGGNVFDAMTGDFDNTVFGASVNYAFSSKLNIELKYDFVNYDNTGVVKEYNYAYGYAKSRGHISAEYSVSKKLMFGAKLDFIGKRNFVSLVNSQNEIVQIGTTIDVSLNAEYKLNNRVSIMLSAENILNQKLYPWNNYPGVGLNILGGVSYKF